MAFAQLPSYPPFDAKSEGVAVRWSKWVSRLTNNLFVADDITDESRKKPCFLHMLGMTSTTLLNLYLTQKPNRVQMSLLLKNLFQH